MDPCDKTTSRVRGTTPEIVTAARQLRLSMTPAEQVLWQALRGKQWDGLKFRSQHPVGRFILDFWYPACRLVVELDGGVYEGQEAHDEARTKALEAYGYHVIRFRNEEVINDLPSLLERIREAAGVRPP